MLKVQLLSGTLDNDCQSALALLANFANCDHVGTAYFATEPLHNQAVATQPAGCPDEVMYDSWSDIRYLSSLYALRTWGAAPGPTSSGIMLMVIQVPHSRVCLTPSIHIALRGSSTTVFANKAFTPAAAAIQCSRQVPPSHFHNNYVSICILVARSGILALARP